MIYLDNAATTRPDSDVVSLVGKILNESFANPSALYAEGLKSENLITQARDIVAQSLCVRQNCIYFTAGGTEGNNIAVLGLYYVRRSWCKNIVISGYEHASVLEPVLHLNRLYGIDVRVVSPDKSGNISPQQVCEQVDKETGIVAVMQVNNETGAVFDSAVAAGLIKQKNRRTAVFCDGVQGFLKLAPVLRDSEIDVYTISGHKVHAPKGVGAIYIKQGTNLCAPFTGGAQESGIRPGTENVAYIAALGQAVKTQWQTVNERYEYIKILKSEFTDELCTGLADRIVVNSPQGASPYILNVSFPGIKSAAVLALLDEVQIMVSAGAACSRGKKSRTLTAMGLPESLINGAIRISFCKDNTKEEVKRAAAAAICTAVKRLTI